MITNEIDLKREEPCTGLDAKKLTESCHAGIRTEIDSILREEIELAKKDDAALIVRSAFDVIEDFLGQGMSLERIASALQKHDFKITKGQLVRHIGIVRAEHGLDPLKRGKRITHSVPPVPTSSPLSSTPQAVLDHRLVKSSTCDTVVSPKPRIIVEFEKKETKHEVKKVTKSEYPEEVTKLIYFNYKGQTYNVLEMNIDDYEIETKKYEDVKDIPPDSKKLIFDESMIRSMYKKGLAKYADAMLVWDRKQESKVLS